MLSKSHLKNRAVINNDLNSPVYGVKYLGVFIFGAIDSVKKKKKREWRGKKKALKAINGKYFFKEQIFN